MAGGAEGDALGGDGRIGVEGVVGGDEAGDVDQVRRKGVVAGLVWRRDWSVGHAVVSFGLLSVLTAAWATIWDASCRRKWAGWRRRLRGSRMTRKSQRKMLVF